MERQKQPGPGPQPQEPPYEADQGQSDRPAGGSTDPHSHLTHDSAGRVPANQMSGAGKGATKNTAGDRKGGDAEAMTRTGDAGADDQTFPTVAGGEKADQLPSDDSGIQPESPEALTHDQGIAVDGGDLAGSLDDFEGELGHPLRPVPGAGDEAKTGLSNRQTQETEEP
jgi:hypothetical protein